jgi:hypothetical protein
MGVHVAALLQRQFLKLHTSALQSHAVAGYQTACARGCPATVAGYQTASLSKGRANMQQQKQQQQSKMYTRRALQALAGKNTTIIKVGVLRDSHNLFSTPYKIFK